MKPHRGQLIMILGILSFVVCAPIMGPIAWIMGSRDLKEMQAGTMDPTGEANTKVGKICGMIATILGYLGICIYIIIIAGVVGSAVATKGTTTNSPDLAPVPSTTR